MSEQSLLTGGNRWQTFCHAIRTIAIARGKIRREKCLWKIVNAIIRRERITGRCFLEWFPSFVIPSILQQDADAWFHLLRFRTGKPDICTCHMVDVSTQVERFGTGRTFSKVRIVKFE